MFILAGIWFLTGRAILTHKIHTKKWLGVSAVIFIGSIALQIFGAGFYKTEMTTAIQHAFTRDNSEAGVQYYQKYRNYIENKQKIADFVFSPEANGDKLGNPIFMVHFESLGSVYLGENTTSGLFSIARKGSFFPEFYANSMQTIRAEEAILCSTPPSLRNTIVAEFDAKKIQELACLPRILKKLGYTALFFQADNLSFADTDKFITNIGFDELHNKDIMRDSDVLLPWGYRDDIFYQRIMEYLEKRRGEKLFVYIAVSAANHGLTDDIDKRYRDQVPNPHPVGIAEHMQNNIFLQDAYFQTFIDNYEKDYAKNSALFITSDTSGPTGKRTKSFQNEAGIFEENFLIPFAFIPPKSQQAAFKTNHIITERLSQVDILPTVVDIIDPKNTFSFFGNSFAGQLLQNAPPENANRTNLFIQPFHGGSISVVQYPKKVIAGIEPPWKGW